MVGHEDVGVERYAIALAIAFEALQIGTGIRVMQDRGAAIPAGEDVIEPSGEVEAWLTGHAGRGVAVGAPISPYAGRTPIRS